MGDGRYFDEMTLAGGKVRPVYSKIARWLGATSTEHLASRRAQAELLFRRMGITFAVYGEKDAGERLIPFDIIPRIMLRSEWARLEAGLLQRVKALNCFLKDVYGAQEIIKAGKIPADLILKNSEFRPEMVGRPVPHDIYVQIAGIDVVRTGEDDFYVLEDNVRTPSGVSYMLENREVMMRLMPDLFAEHRVAPRRELSRRAAGGAALRRSARERRAIDHRSPDARPLQLGLLRTFVSGRQARRRARRGTRSFCRRRQALHAHDTGREKDRRALPAHRR
ncbi:protein of unknown function [Methylocella tundrae]|uniref:Circularly permuted ATPgrasp domain-containing protein n=1 Tax=Methylocella tundrae TaxID=227605 RepID=A0A4U8Z2E5_METTU|nr:protein of unknown function [Methylocella tundrae]